MSDRDSEVPCAGVVLKGDQPGFAGREQLKAPHIRIDSGKKNSDAGRRAKGARKNG